MPLAPPPPPAARPALNRLRRGGDPRPAAALASAQPRRQPADGGNPPGAAARLRAAQFMDFEAALSGEDDGGVGEDEDGMDGFESDFIDDATQPPGSGAPGSGPSGAGAASLAAFHHRRLQEDGPSPSPLALLRQLQHRRLGRQVLDTPGAGGARGARGVDGGTGEDAYDSDDSFIDDGEEGPGEDEHDDECAACHRSDGTLLLCDGCPAAYHLACCHLAAVPEGESLLGRSPPVRCAALPAVFMRGAPLPALCMTSACFQMQGTGFVPCAWTARLRWSAGGEVRQRLQCSSELQASASASSRMDACAVLALSSRLHAATMPVQQEPCVLSYQVCIFKFHWH